jgi:hypothetical protein
MGSRQKPTTPVYEQPDPECSIRFDNMQKRIIDMLNDNHAVASKQNELIVHAINNGQMHILNDIPVKKYYYFKNICTDLLDFFEKNDYNVSAFSNYLMDEITETNDMFIVNRHSDELYETLTTLIELYRITQVIIRQELERE